MKHNIRGENVDRKFTVYKHIADISKPNNGWTKELNYISWDNESPYMILEHGLMII